MNIKLKTKNSKSRHKVETPTKASGLKTHKGFTLIEILIYISLITIITGLLSGILLTITQVYQRESASDEVTSQLNFVMQTIQRLVRESSNIEITAGVATSTLKLRMASSTKDITCILLDNGNKAIKLAEGTDANCSTNLSNLTSDKVKVDVLNFTKLVQYPGHDTVSIELTMSYNTQNPKSQVQRTLQSAIGRVSAATFDDNLIPGTNNSFDLGNSGTRWKSGYFSDGIFLKYPSLPKCSKISVNDSGTLITTTDIGCP